MEFPSRDPLYLQLAHWKMATKFILHGTSLSWYIKTAKQKAEQLGPTFLLHISIAFPCYWSPGPARTSLLLTLFSTSTKNISKHNTHKNQVTDPWAEGAAPSNSHCHSPLAAEDTAPWAAHCWLCCNAATESGPALPDVPWAKGHTWQEKGWPANNLISWRHHQHLASLFRL